jgi:hypothetical protein
VRKRLAALGGPFRRYVSLQTCTITQMISIIDGQTLSSPTETCNIASKKGIHVDMLKSAALNKPAVTKPNAAEPITVPATLTMRNVIKTMRANITLDPRSFRFGSFGSWINGSADIGAMFESWYAESWDLGE